MYPRSGSFIVYYQCNPHKMYLLQTSTMPQPQNGQSYQYGQSGVQNEPVQSKQVSGNLNMSEPRMSRWGQKSTGAQPVVQSNEQRVGFQKEPQPLMVSYLQNFLFGKNLRTNTLHWFLP